MHPEKPDFFSFSYRVAVGLEYFLKIFSVNDRKEGLFSELTFFACNFIAFKLFYSPRFEGGYGLQQFHYMFEL